MRCPSCHRRLNVGDECSLHPGAIASPPERAVAAPPALVGFSEWAPLGAGGFAQVFSARFAPHGEVAVKIALRSNDERFAIEAAALVRIGPPAVPRFITSGVTADGRPYFASELVKGSALATLLASRSVAPMTLDEALPLFHALCASVARIHAAGVVHRDLKPENVFVRADGGVTVIDLGLARTPGSRESLGDRVALTETGQLLGTTTYMAPEQCRGDDVIDCGADIYALGVMLFEMLAGRPPFVGDPRTIEQAHLSHRPPRLSTFVSSTEALEQVIARCLAKRPAERFAGADELAAALAKGGIAFAERDPPDRTESRSARANTQRIALLAVRGAIAVNRITSIVREAGGHVVQLSAGKPTVCAFAAGGETRAVRAAVRVAERLSPDAELAVVHVAELTTRQRADTVLFVGAAISQPERWMPTAAATGIVLTQAAADAANADVRQSNQPGFFTVASGATVDESVPVARVPLVGRGALVDELVEEVRSSHRQLVGSIVTVVGEAGQGKTHIAAAVAEALAEYSTLRVLRFTAPRPESGVDTDSVLKQLLRIILGVGDGNTTIEQVRDACTRTLGNDDADAAWPVVALALGVIREDDAALAPLRVAPGAIRQMTAHALGVALRRFASRHPLALLLDDAQWSDQVTLDAIDYATLAEAGAPICAIAFVRPSFEDVRPMWGSRAGRHRIVRLPSLEPGDAAQLCRALLQPAENVPARIIDVLVQRTERVPQLLVDLVAALRRDGGIRRSAKGSAWYVATDLIDQTSELPLVQWLAARELQSMPKDLAAHTRLISLLGGDFGTAELQGVTHEMVMHSFADQYPLDAAVALERLVATDVIVDRGRGRFGFRNDLVREAIDREVPPLQRRAIHEAASRHYERNDAASSTEVLARIAYHAAHCGLRSRAADAYLALARAARTRHAYLDAEMLFTRAIEQLPASGAETARAFQGRGLMRYRLAQYDRALADFAVAGKQAHALGDRMLEIGILLDESEALDWSEQHHRSHELVEEAHALAASGSSPVLSARLLMARGRSSYRFNRDEEAARLLAAAASMAEAIGDEGYETLVISLLLVGYVLATLGRLDESERAFDRVIPLCESRSDKLHLGAALGNRMILWTCRNDRERMVTDLRRLLEVSREIGNLRMEQHANFYLAQFLHWSGDDANAVSYAKRAVTIDEGRLGTSARPESALLLARILVTMDPPEEARAALDAIRVREERQRLRSEAATEMLPHEQVFAAMVALALDGFEETRWSELQSRAERYLTGQHLIEFLECRGSVALQHKEYGAAVAAFAKALDLARQIPNTMSERIERRLKQARGCAD